MTARLCMFMLSMGGGEAAFEFRDGGVVLRESAGMKVSELRRA